MIKLLTLSVLVLAVATPAFAGERAAKRAPASACEDAKCPLNMIRCEPPLERVDVREEGACCPKWKCEEPEGQNRCRFAKCPKRFVQCKPGEKKVDKRPQGTCCPRWRCIPADEEEVDCRDAKCPMNMIHCPRGKKRIDVRKPGTCCPSWKCVDKDDALAEDAMAGEEEAGAEVESEE